MQHSSAELSSVLGNEARSEPKSCKPRDALVVLITLFFAMASGIAFAQSASGNCVLKHLSAVEPGVIGEELCFADRLSEDPHPDAESAATPAKARHQAGVSRFALAIKLSSLGVGGDVAFRIHSGWNLRAGLNGFAYHRTVTDGAIDYAAALRLRSIQTVVDWFPFSKPFHVSPGLALYNGNQVVANAIMPLNKTLSAAGKTFTSSANDPVIATARSSMRRTAPLMLFGFGNPAPPKAISLSTQILGLCFKGYRLRRFWSREPHATPMAAIVRR